MRPRSYRHKRTDGQYPVTGLAEKYTCSTCTYPHIPPYSRSGYVSLESSGTIEDRTLFYHLPNCALVDRTSYRRKFNYKICYIVYYLNFRRQPREFNSDNSNIILEEKFGTKARRFRMHGKRSEKYG